MLRLLLLVALVLPHVDAGVALGDDEIPFRPTSPRIDVVANDGTGARDVEMGVPGGRAWGLESVLLRLPRGGAEVSEVSLDLAVVDPSVREAFVRVAWYEEAEGRPAQIATQDSAMVRFGERASVSVRLDPPAGAVAYRIRVLVRILPDLERSAPRAIRIGDGWSDPPSAGSAPRTQLLPD